MSRMTFEDPTDAQEQAAAQLAATYDRVRVHRIPAGDRDLMVEGIMDPAPLTAAGYIGKAPRVTVLRIAEDGKVRVR